MRDLDQKHTTGRGKENGGLSRVGDIEKRIYFIRGCKVMLDRDEVETKRLKEQVKRNLERFPDDFMFDLSYQEVMNLRPQITASGCERWGDT